MATELSPTSYIVLGLLERAGRATPYDLKAAVGAGVGNLWSVPHSQVYAEPARLARGGYVREERETGGRRRRTYELTAAGREALSTWRAEPTAVLPELRDPALLKLFFGADPATVAREQAGAHEAKLIEYAERRAAIAEDPALRGPALTLDAGIAHERVWIAYWRALAGLAEEERFRAVTLDLADLAVSPTAALFEGHPRAGVDASIFVTRTPPARAVELHVHPYAETFLLLEGRGRWTRGDEVVELEPEQILVVPPDTPHGFRNVGEVPLLVVSVHERGTLSQTWLGEEPA